MARQTVRSLWRDIIKSEWGPEPLTRLLLLLLADYMGPDGDDCYPSIKRIAQEAGVAYSTARKHIGEAVENGWLVRESRGRGYEYRPSIPPRAGANWDQHRRDTAGWRRRIATYWRSIVPGAGGVKRLQKRLQRDTTGRESAQENGDHRPKTVTCEECGTDFKPGVNDRCPYCEKEERRQSA